MASDRFEERIKKIERILHHDFSHESIDEETEVVAANHEAEKKPASGAMGIEPGIMDALKHGERSTTEILAHVSSSEICSQATLFRYLKKMAEEGKIHRRRKGKSVFYSVKAAQEACHEKAKNGKNDGMKSQKKKAKKR